MFTIFWFEFYFVNILTVLKTVADVLFLKKKKKKKKKRPKLVLTQSKLEGFKKWIYIYG